MRARLGDSKKLLGHGNTALGEAWARAIARRMGVANLEGPDALVHALSLDGPAVLRARCPTDHTEQCWNRAGESFRADDALVADVERDLAKLAAQGIDVLYVACVVTCTRRLNDEIGAGATGFTSTFTPWSGFSSTDGRAPNATSSRRVARWVASTSTRPRSVL